MSDEPKDAAVSEKGSPQEVESGKLFAILSYLGLWFIQSLYEQGKYSQLFEIANRYHKKLHLADDVGQVVTDSMGLWSKGVPVDMLKMGKH